MNITTILGGIVLVGLVGIAVHNAGQPTVAVNSITATSTVEVTPDWASDPEAVEAAEAVIRKKELEAEEARLVDEITGKQNELDAVRKELGTY